MSCGVVLLAGGEATRLPGKLELPLGGVPLVVRTFRNVNHGRPLVVACKGSFSRDVDAGLTAPLAIDRRPRRGPLCGLLTALTVLRTERAFAVAGDAPFAGASLLDDFEAGWRDGDEAVVPQWPGGNGGIQPLPALFDRIAFLHAGARELRDGRGSIAGALARLRVRAVTLPGGASFASINTPAQYAQAAASLEGASSS